MKCMSIRNQHAKKNRRRIIAARIDYDKTDSTGREAVCEKLLGGNSGVNCIHMDSRTDKRYSAEEKQLSHALQEGRC